MPKVPMAEVDDCAHGTPAYTAGNLKSGTDMDEVDWDQERSDRVAAIDCMLADENAERIRAGIAAYNRDLPQLLRDDKERYVVAYDWGTRVGLAASRQELLSELKQKGLANRGDILIKIVTREEDRETSCTSGHL